MEARNSIRSRGTEIVSTAARKGDGLEAAWAALCDALKEMPAETILRPEAGQTPLDRAEGYRYLTRLARIAFDEFLEDADGRFPRFYTFNTPHKKILLDNPDTLYWRAPLSADCEYRVRGRRGTIAYVDFAVYSGYYGSSGPTGTDSHMNHRELETDAQGNYEITLSATERSGNWLRLGPHSSRFEVRQSFLDRDGEIAATAEIERIGGSSAPPPLEPRQIERALFDTRDHMRGISGLIFEMAAPWQRHPNEFEVFDPERASELQSNADSHYANAFWKLAADEAWVIDFEPVRADYWSLNFTNCWMETQDYRYQRSGLNAHQAQAEADASVRVVLAHRNPGVLNFVSTGGHESGYATFRWILADGRPEVRTRVASIAELEALR